MKTQVSGLIRRPGRCLAISAASLLLVGSSALADSRALRVVKDATQTEVKLVDRPARVVTLAPSLAELAADFCGNNLSRIVGVSEYTDYPPALSKVTSIGPYTQFNLEKVVALKPDLVLATLDGNPKDRVLHLRELGLPVVVVDTASFKDVESSMRQVGAAMGVPKEGESMAKRFATGLDRIREKIRAQTSKKKTKPRVLLQIGDEPLVTVGKGTFLHEAAETLLVENAYGDSTTHYPRPSLEDVVHRDPDVIVVLALGHDLSSFQAMGAKWSSFKTLKAVKNKRVHVLQADAVLRPSLRLLEGLSALKGVIGE